MWVRCWRQCWLVFISRPVYHGQSLVQIDIAVVMIAMSNYDGQMRGVRNPIFYSPPQVKFWITTMKKSLNIKFYIQSKWKRVYKTDVSVHTVEHSGITPPRNVQLKINKYKKISNISQNNWIESNSSHGIPTVALTAGDLKVRLYTAPSYLQNPKHKSSPSPSFPPSLPTSLRKPPPSMTFW